MSSLVSACDSYYSYVVAQMSKLNATVYINGATIPQPFAGIINAQDWPQAPIVEGGLYLLVIRAVPVQENPGQANIEYEYYCQWVWILIGTDTKATDVSANRGDRYRASMQIMDNLRQANYPGYCQRMDYSGNADGSVSATAVTDEFGGYDWVKWSKLTFIPHVDNDKAGVVYGAATVDIRAYSDIAAAVA